MPGQQRRKIWKTILFIIVTMAATIGVMVLGITWTPNLSTSTSPLFQQLLAFGIVFGPLVVMIAVIFRLIEQSNPVRWRIKPVTKVRNFIIPWVIILGFFNGLLVFDLLVSKIILDDLDKSLLAALAVILNLFIVLLFLGQLPSEIQVKRKFGRSSGTADARITHKSVKENIQSDGDGRVSYSYSYTLTVEFVPKLAGNVSDKMILEAAVNEKIYEQLGEGQIIKIRYATEDPRIFLIEGE